MATEKPICIFDLLPWQEKAWMDDSPVLLFTQNDGKSAGGGKALSLDTEILISEGFKSMQEVEIGDVVYDDKRNLCKVIGVTPLLYNRPCYELEFSSGKRVIADAEHSWIIRAIAEQKRGAIYTINANVINTKEIFKRVGNLRYYVDKKRYVKSVIPIESVPVKCIEVDSYNGSYLITRSAIPTHNSRCAAEKIHGYCQKYPGTMALMLRKTRESTTNSIVLFMQTEVIGKHPDVAHYSSKSRFEYANGSMLAYGGMANEDQREQIRSMGLKGGLDCVWMEEANQFAEDDYNEILARMRGTAADWRQVILSCNPDSPAHWIYQRLILGGEAKVYTSGASDNPYNPDDYLKTLDTLTGVLRERLKEGKWVQATGVVYDSFNPIVHVIDKLPDIGFKRAFSSVDWGYSNPGVILTFLIDNDDRMYLVNEIYRTKQIIDWWISKAKGIVQEYPYHEIFIPDPSEPANIEKFNREGLNAEGGNNNVSLGIQEVVNRLAIAGDGKPRLYFLRNALKDVDTELENKKQPTGILDEITIYSWKKDRSGIVTKEEPEKKNDHSMDGLRYACMYLAEPERPAIYLSSRSMSTDKLLAQLGVG